MRALNQDQVRAGLMTAEKAVPLLGVDVRARVDGPFVEVTLRQRYLNSSDQAIEAQYVFPLDESAAVSGFRAHLGETTVVGAIEEREAAFEQYDDAIAEGNAAFLMDQQRDDVFTAWVGNLKAGEEATIELRYVAELRLEGPAFRFQLPTTVAPRYAGPETDPEEAAAVNPERWFEVPYGLTLEVEVDGLGALSVLESPSHPVSVRMREGGATVSLGKEVAAMDRDFILKIEPEAPHRPFARLAEGPEGERFALLSFLPELPDAEPTPAEVIFLLDCSGSMRGASIQQAKQALELCIRSLGPSDTFNVTRFGSKHENLFSRSLKVTDKNLEKTRNALKKVDADLGGTEILSPLAHLLKTQPKGERERFIVVLTDGQVASERDVIQHVRKHHGRTRIFSFAIGSAASQYLVRGLAREGRGESETIHPGERIEPKVLRTFGRMRSPRLTNVSIDWSDLEVTTAKDELPPIFQGESLNILARIDAGEAESVRLKAGGETHELTLDSPVDDSPIALLWARERIRTLEWKLENPRSGSLQQRKRDNPAREKLVDLSKRYGLTSSVTSFVGVIERAEGEKNEGPDALVQVPLQLNAGWGGFPQAAGVPASTMSMAMAGAAGGAPMAQAAPMPRSKSSRRRGGRVRAAFDAFAPKAKMAEMSGVMDSMEESESIAVQDQDPLYTILLAQRADGGFALDDALEEWLGDRLAEARSKHAGDDDDVIIARLLLELLRSDFADRKAEWKAAAAKAERWLKTA